MYMWLFWGIALALYKAIILIQIEYNHSGLDVHVYIWPLHAYLVPYISEEFPNNGGSPMEVVMQ